MFQSLLFRSLDLHFHRFLFFNFSIRKIKEDHDKNKNRDRNDVINSESKVHLKKMQLPYSLLLLCR